MQTVQLQQMKLFQWMQLQLEQVTPEMIARAKHNDPIPNGAKILGIMPEYIKKLNAFRVQYEHQIKSTLEEQAKKTYVGAGWSPQKYDQMYARYMRRVDFIKICFWQALEEEFPNLIGPSVGYGPNWEVWQQDEVITTQEQSPGLVISINLGS
jgi:hypothetical protein